MLISVVVFADRLKYGTLSCGAFSCRCYCKADNGAADAAGNPTRDPRSFNPRAPRGARRPDHNSLSRLALGYQLREPVRS